MAIPFKTLRFEPDNTTWGINFFRNDLGSNEYHSWTPLPVNWPEQWLTARSSDHVARQGNETADKRLFATTVGCVGLLC